MTWQTFFCERELQNSPCCILLSSRTTQHSTRKDNSRKPAKRCASGTLLEERCGAYFLGEINCEGMLGGGRAASDVWCKLEQKSMPVALRRRRCCCCFRVERNLLRPSSSLASKISLPRFLCKKNLINVQIRKRISQQNKNAKTNQMVE